VLLASSEAAASVWVCDELKIWCGELKRVNNLLIVLTKDEIAFEPATKRVEWTATTALPAFLGEYLADSPLYVDLRWVTEEQQLDLANAKFKREINRLAARLNDIDPEQMLNKEVITHRRNVWLARGAVTVLAVFALAAVAGLVVALQQRGRAVVALASEQVARDKAEVALANEKIARDKMEVALANEKVARDRAEAEAAAAASNLLATRARQRTAESPQLGVLLAAEAVYRLLQKQLAVTSAAAQTLLDMFQNVSGIALGGHRLERARDDPDEGATISAVAVSPDSKWIATGDADGRVLLRRSDRPEQWVKLIAGASGGRSREGEIHGLQFSADSKRLAATLFDEVRVWDISGRPKQIARCTGRDQFVYDALFTADSRWLISSSGSGIRVWDLKAQPPLGELLPDTKGLRAVLAMNGDLVVSDAGYVWRWRERQLVRQLPGIDGNSVSLAVSSQGDKVAVGTSKGDVHVWWIATEEHKVFHHDGFIPMVAFSPDGNSLASASWNRTAKLWDLTGKEQEITYEHDGQVEAVAFHPSGNQLATIGADRRLRVWGTYWLYTPAPMVLGGHDGNSAAQHLVFASNGTFLVSGGYEPLPRLWRLNQLNPGVNVFRGSSYGPVESFAFNTKTQRLAAVSRNKGPDLWRLDAPERRVVTLPDADNNAFQVALSSDGAWLASSGVGTNSSLWRLDAQGQSPRRLRSKTGYHNKVLFSYDALIGALEGDGSIALESVTQPNAPVQKLRGGNKPAVDFAFSSNLPRVAAIYPDGSAYVWDTAASTRQQIATGAPSRAPIGVAFSADGTHVAVADAAFIDWIDLGTRSSVHLIPPNGHHIAKFVIAPGGKHIAAGTDAGTTLLWDLTNAVSRRDLALHTIQVLAVAFSPAGDWLASATRASIGIWALRDLGAAPLRLSPEQVKYMAPLTSDRSTGVSDLQFIDQHRVAASTSDDLVVVWDLDFAKLIARACEVAGRQLRPDEVVNQLDRSPATACTSRAPPANRSQAR
jgi:WD40 repeat protein